MARKKKAALIPVERIERSILLIRDQKIILDKDLADLYGIETRTLTQAVKRNVARFPDDFMFQLSKDEFDILKSQSVDSRQWGGRRYPPYAFTEQGVAMLSSVLRSPQAIDVNVEITRTFVRLRHMIASHDKLAQKLTALEKKYDHQFSAVFDAIRQLMQPPKNAARSDSTPKQPGRRRDDTREPGCYLRRLHQIKAATAPHTNKMMLPGSGILATRNPMLLFSSVGLKP